jgi:beta-lactamase superfamily II metal-dependent hydrolase
MSYIKSFSVGNGDMFYIKHDTDNFTIIDCCLTSERQNEIIEEVKFHSHQKGITRFISTSPDFDHIKGLAALDDAINIVNLYVVKNNAIKNIKNDDFIRYCELRDHEKKPFYIFKDCKRKWMNESDQKRGSSGIHILWPQLDNMTFIDELAKTNAGESPNNISPIIQYSASNNLKVIWMGDLESAFLDTIKDVLKLPKVHILFAPHHGRDSGKVPKFFLDQLSPDIIVIGEASSDYLNYYQGYNTITQNSAGDITFECRGNIVDVYVSNLNYRINFLRNDGIRSYENYLGSLIL